MIALAIGATWLVSWLDPMKMLTREAKGARWLAIDARHRTQDQDPLLLERWNDFAARHPEVTAVLREADKRNKAWWKMGRVTWKF